MTLSEILKKYSVDVIQKQKPKHNKDFYNKKKKSKNQNFDFNTSDARLLVLANIQKYGEEYSLITTKRIEQQ